MNHLELDPRVTAWLREERPGAPASVLEAAIDHARRHAPRSHPALGWRGLAIVATLGRHRAFGLRPALAVGGVAVAVVLVGAVFLGSQYGQVGPGPAATPSVTPTSTPSSSPSGGDLLPQELRGTWFSTDGTIVALRGCAVGEDCGTLERIEAGEHCVYPLAYRLAGADYHLLGTGTGITSGCADSPWSDGIVRVMHKPYNDLLDVSSLATDAPAPITLHRLGVAPGFSAAPELTPTPPPSSGSSGGAVLPSELLGRWFSADGPVVTLHPCRLGEECGILERIDDNAEHCIYPLVYSLAAPGYLELATGLGNTFGCAYSGWSSGTIRLAPQPGDLLELRLVPAYTTSPMTLYRSAS